MIRTVYQSECRLVAGLALLLVSALGCRTGEYEQRLSGVASQLEQGSAFAGMKPAAVLNGTNSTLKVPNAFQSQPMGEGAGMDEKRLKLPNGVTMAGLQWTYEEFLAADANGGKTAFYCYLGVAEVTGQRGNDPFAVIQRQANANFGGTNPPIETVQCSTPQGQTAEWKKIRFSGQQEFYYVDKDGNGDLRTMSGVVEVYGRQEGNTMILIGWRVPCDENGNPYHDKLAQWTDLVAGSLSSQ